MLRVLDRRFHIVIRLEPQNHHHRYVEYYGFQVIREENTFECKLVKHKLEIKENVFYIYDIYGIENIKKLRYDKDSPVQCIICLDQNISVIILPCRHMCLCLKCTNLFQEKKQDNKPVMKHECPICRMEIKSFINIKGLKFE